MRLRILLALTCAAVATACSGQKAPSVAKVGADWGCIEIGGVERLAASGAPEITLIGEFTETSEGPAAFAEIACQLARTGEPLLVGFSEYFGGATDAETRMWDRLDDLKARGAPITTFIASDGHDFGAEDRNKAEAVWAKRIEDRIAASGAKRALILVADSDALLLPAPDSARAKTYKPMPLHLQQHRVVSLEIARVPGLLAPAIRLYPEPAGGFSGQLVLASLTRPELAMYHEPEPTVVPFAAIDMDFPPSPPPGNPMEAVTPTTREPTEEERLKAIDDLPVFIVDDSKNPASEH
jgi:hypothetical protein